ncbi:uncharacterized protein LOC143537847 [Bidens hawaiensis]|uniref:uncharacterized protein LOC143537847 n=1 Tax=Bidens hawaiensis TaxID=980011 RepID=UPI00404B3D61
MGPFTEASGHVKFLILAIDYFTKWVETASMKKFIWEFIICRFGLPQTIVSDNGTQFMDDGLQAWLKELQINQVFTSVVHPQANGQNPKENKQLRNTIHRDIKHKGHDSAEIGIPSARSLSIVDNDEELCLNLNLLKERRELAIIRESNYKCLLQKCYDSKFKICKFQAGDFVFCNNEASSQEPSGKLAPTWDYLIESKKF